MNYLEDLINRLGPEVLPFERTEPSKKPAEEEVIDFSQQAYNAIKDDSPTPYSHHVMANEIKITGQLDEKQSVGSDSLSIPYNKMYIWLIYIKDGGLEFRIIPDSMENSEGKKKVGGRPNVCHSNISAGDKALQGGECWWCDETKTMYVNYKSGRYRAVTMAQWDAVIEFFNYVGYKNVVRINPKGWTLRN
jgi:hypothetical protein